MKNYYAILGVERGASFDEIKKAYRINAVKLHPDRHFGDSVFEKKFIEINEAYQILNNPSKKEEYDLEWDEFYNNIPAKETASVFEETEVKKPKEKEEKFYYQPHRPIFRSSDREQNQTDPTTPKYEHWGNELPENVEFFTFPSKIGKILTGYSTLKNSDKPVTTREASKNLLKGFGIGISIGLIIVLLFGINDPVWMGIWMVIPTILLIWVFSKSNKFKHYQNFIGINGFAEYECEDRKDNITKQSEINFNEITDLAIAMESRSYNFQYQNTAYEYIWFNRESGAIPYVAADLIYDKQGNPPKDESPNYWLNKDAEKHWTFYLLDTMEEKLENDGYIEFNLFLFKENTFVPYIRLGIGSITFLDGENNFTYKFNEIKRVYTKGNDLFIEHKNYEKKFIFMKSGNADRIPLMNLCNRQFFFKAFEILLGYRFS